MNPLYMILFLMLGCTEQPGRETRNETEIPEKECDCPEPYQDAPFSRKINYQGGFLKFCSFDYDSLTRSTVEFAIFNNTDSMLYEGEVAFRYVLEGFSAPFVFVQEHVRRGGPNADFYFDPVGRVKVERNGNSFNLEEQYIYKPDRLSREKQDSLLSVWKSQPEHHDDYDPMKPPYTGEEFIYELFLCAVGGNQECLHAYETYYTKFVTDGSSSELYHELNSIVISYKRHLAND